MPAANETHNELVHAGCDRTLLEKVRDRAWPDLPNPPSFVFRPTPISHAQRISFQAMDTKPKCRCHPARTHAPSSTSFERHPTSHQGNQTAKRIPLRSHFRAATLQPDKYPPPYRPCPSH